MSTTTFSEARNRALTQAVEADDSVIVMGGIAGRPGSVLGIPAELADRNIDISISELAAAGAAIGAALVGMRPVLTVHQGSFFFQSWPQIVQEATKHGFASGGKVKVPVVFHMDTGITGDAEAREANAALSAEGSTSIFDKPFGSKGAQHAISPEGMLCNVPGLQIVSPSTPADGAGLLLSAIASDVPTVLVEHHDLLFQTGEVSDPLEVVPIGSADVKREGSDLTIVTYSVNVQRALKAAENLAAEGIEAEVIDLRSLAPLDAETIIGSVAKTGRLLVTDQGHRTGGVASNVAALVAERGFAHLRAPIAFACLPDVPIPFAPELIDHITPTVAKIQAAAAKLASS